MVNTLRSDKLVFGGWKLTIDGGVGAGTMLMYDKSMPGSRIAYPYFSQDEFNRIVKILHDAGLQIAVHVGGDQGIDMTITAFEEAMKANPRPVLPGALGGNGSTPAAAAAPAVGLDYQIVF